MSVKKYENNKWVTDFAPLLERFPIQPGESSVGYCERTISEAVQMGYEYANVHSMSKCILKRGYFSIKTKASETLVKGELVSEKFRYVAEDEIDKSGMTVKSVTTNPYGGQWIKYRDNEDVDYLSEIKNVLSEIKFDKAPPIKKDKSKNAIKITLSDIHVGMCVESDSLFEYKYGKDEFYRSLDHVYETAMEYSTNGRFDVLILQDLADGLDGYNNKTTRGGHELDQSMTNNEAFRIYVHGKLQLIDRLYKSGIANKIMVRDSANCNHAGDFGYMANYAVKLAGEQMYKGIDYKIFERFIDHFEYGDHCFIQCHGKDKKYMKSGMPLKLDDKTQRFIQQYIDRYRIKSKYIHFEKADLHQVGYNKCKQFDYRNYMSFAPPSNWVQHNFGDGYSGYSIQIISPENGSIKHMDCFLDYEIKSNSDV